MTPKEIKAFCRTRALLLGDNKGWVSVEINNGHPLTLKDFGLIVQCSGKCNFCKGKGEIINVQNNPFADDDKPTLTIIKAE